MATLPFVTYFAPDVTPKDAYVTSYPQLWLSDSPAVRSAFDKMSRVNGWEKADYLRNDRFRSFIQALRNSGVDFTPFMDSMRMPLRNKWSMGDAYGREQVDNYGKFLGQQYDVYDPDGKYRELGTNIVYPGSDGQDKRSLDRYEKYDESLADLMLYRQLSAALPMDVPEVYKKARAQIRNGASPEQTVAIVKDWMTNGGENTIEEFLESTKRTTPERALSAIAATAPAKFILNDVFQAGTPNEGIVDPLSGIANQVKQYGGLGLYLAGKPIQNHVSTFSTGVGAKALAKFANPITYANTIKAGMTAYDIINNPDALARHIQNEMLAGRDPEKMTIGQGLNTAAGAVFEAGAMSPFLSNANTRQAAITAARLANDKFNQQYIDLIKEVKKSDFAKALPNMRLNPNTGEYEAVEGMSAALGRRLGEGATRYGYTVGSPTLFRSFAPNIARRAGLGHVIGLGKAARLNAIYGLGTAGYGLGRGVYGVAKNGLENAQTDKEYGTDKQLSDFARDHQIKDVASYVIDPHTNKIDYTKLGKLMLLRAVEQGSKTLNLETAPYTEAFNTAADLTRMGRDKLSSMLNADTAHVSSTPTMGAMDLSMFRNLRKKGLNVAQAKAGATRGGNSSGFNFGSLDFNKEAYVSARKAGRSVREARAAATKTASEAPGADDAVADKIRDRAAEANEEYGAPEVSGINQRSQDIINAYNTGGKAGVANKAQGHLMSFKTLLDSGNSVLQDYEKGRDDLMKARNRMVTGWIPFLNKSSLTAGGRAWQQAQVLNQTALAAQGKLKKWLPWVRGGAMIAAPLLAYLGYQAHRRFNAPRQQPAYPTVYAVPPPEPQRGLTPYL